MMDQETVDKLQGMRLRTMAQVFRELVDKPEDSLSFAEKVGMMVDREWVERDNRRTGRRVKEAKFPSAGRSRKSSPTLPAVSTRRSCARSRHVAGCAPSKT